MPAARSQSLSLVLHLVAMTLLLLLTSQSFSTPPPLNIPNLTHAIPLAPPPIKVRQIEKQGGGSNSSTLPARQGAAPPRASRPFIPPELHADPKLPLNISIDFEAPITALTTIGDPLSKIPGYGIGDKEGRGIGRFPGANGIGDASGLKAAGRIGMPTKPAEVIYQVDPEFSEDARKAKFQGIVVLMIEIGVDGRAHKVQVVEDPGLGLGEKAREAVGKWRFRPAQTASSPVVSTARIEVHFHLM